MTNYEAKEIMKDFDDERYMQDFYEEISLKDSLHGQDQTDTPGLSHENVHKLTEDIMNPLPPADEEI